MLREKMQRVVLDTNVLVSSLIQRSHPYRIVNDFLLSRKIELCISDSVLAEYYDVLNRKKFSKYSDFLEKSEAMLADIELNANKFRPRRKLKIIRDHSDNKFLELSETSKAHFLITGNTNDFTMRNYKRTKIVTPKEYLEKYCPD